MDFEGGADLDYMQVEEALIENPFAKVSDLAYKILQNDILTYKILPGTRLNCSQIAKDLSISRTPVGEAIERLMEEGLVETFSDKTGYYVFQMPRSELEDLFLARKLIEGKAAYLCTIGNIEFDRDHLKGLAIEFKEVFDSKNFEDLSRVDMEFHQTIINASKNKFLIDMYRSLEKMISYHSNRTGHFLSVEQPMDEKVLDLSKQHISIYKSIELGIPKMAENAMYAHLDSCIYYARQCHLY